MACDRIIDARWKGILPARSRPRVLTEIAVSYVLIMVVIWTPRPYQRWMWWVASATVIASTCASFDGLGGVGHEIHH